MSLKKLLLFTDCLNKFRLVKRVIFVNGEDRMENDMEHSYTLAMLAWYIIDAEKLKLDLFKVLKYTLAHDFVEVYAGDTYIYGSIHELETKHKREEYARKKLKRNFPEMKNFHSAIISYERREDLESRFVYALDKLQPVLNIYLDKGRTWNEAKISLNMIIKEKENKVCFSPEVKKYWDELLIILKKGEKKLFKQ